MKEEPPTQLLDPAHQKEGHFEEFWQAYPRKVGKGKAREAYARARRSTDDGTLLAQVERFARAMQGKDPQYVPHPTTWLNQERWHDEYADPVDLPEGWYLRPDGNRVDPCGRLWDAQGYAL